MGTYTWNRQVIHSTETDTLVRPKPYNNSLEKSSLRVPPVSYPSTTSPDSCIDPINNRIASVSASRTFYG
jgi:hypothetical protein